jgi:hypothetical protein
VQFLEDLELLTQAFSGYYLQLAAPLELAELVSLETINLAFPLEDLQPELVSFSLNHYALIGVCLGFLH